MHWERVLGYVGPDDKLPEKNSVGNASYFFRLKTLLGWRRKRRIEA